MGDADRATAGDAAPGYRVRAHRGQSTNPRSLTERKLCSLLLDKEQQNNILGNLLQDMGDADRATAGDAAPGYRVKARRGQSTNPRSLTERERRAKITQNLKALHQLIPGANQTVRSSMLDEINEYIKLLQQQVKVLSTSNLGGAGALGPPTVNVPVEGSGIPASTAVGEAAGSLSPEAQEFEKTILKYMETDMKAATAYLVPTATESKGFYLIPIAQATPMSDRTGNPGLGSPVTDLLLRENRCIEREREVPTPESIEDLMIISSLRKTMEKE